ncbi:MAG TPA: hypothetical protein VD835_03395 [Pyrinomonadaceae bacterium]|nr:hypothetical protein [Pyrinomonadaceae bacterium]
MLELRQRFTAHALAIVVAIGCIAPLAVAAQKAPRAPGDAPKVIPISEARTLSVGAPVTVEGSITVASGLFKSGTSDAGFAMQDGSGGFYVRMTENLGLRIGQQVRVSGLLADSFGQLVLDPIEARNVKVRGRGMKVRAEAVSTGRIGEATEGRLVQVTGTITKPVGNDLPYGYRVFINDGSGEVQVFVYASTHIDVSGLQPGQRIVVKGFSAQYSDHYEVIPRSQSDIRPSR